MRTLTVRVALFFLAGGLVGCAASRPNAPLRGCDRERLGEDVEGFRYRIDPDSIEVAVEAEYGETVESMYRYGLEGIAREDIAALETEAREGASLWYFYGPRWPSWMGVAAVRDCEVVYRWIIGQE